MAESLVSDVVSQLSNFLIQEAVSLGGVRDQIKQLETEFHQLQGFLKDADSRRKKGGARMESWISEIRDVAYEMEDVIDTIKHMRERRHQRRGFMGTISRYSHKPRELITLHKISSRIDQIKIKIENIFKGKERYGIADIDESSAVDESWQSLRQSSPHSDDDDIDVIGFENDKKELMSQLLDRNEKTRCVISIVGMGGLGKTTLARKLYNDPKITKHFGSFSWVSVSQEYRGIELVKDIIKNVKRTKMEESGKKFTKALRTVEEPENGETHRGITIEELEKMSEEEARKKLRDFLKDKRYLVVVDDVWTADVWEQMQQVFPDENNGSRILLTTREMDVANRARSCFAPHQLRTLNDAESLKLLCSKAFPPKQDVPTDFNVLAQKLAKKCGGLPLALVVLGGLLLGKGRNYDAWCSVAESINWESTGDGPKCFNILGLSYKDLKDTLKKCFLHIATFPDSTISTSKLVRLWIAEDFTPQRPNQTLERTGRDCLDELVQRCMIQVVRRRMADGRVQSIRVHDMLREFGQSEARNDGFIHVYSSDDMAISGGTSIHRVTFHNRINQDVVVSSPHLHTLLGFNVVLTDAGRFLNGLNLLRVLDLEDAEDLKELPKQIGNMIYLRYLGLRNTGLKRLPSSIGNLLNLRTLDVRETQIIWLPKSFWKIRTLRHVYINIAMFLSAPMSDDQKNLQTLHITRSSFTKEACEGMDGKSLRKALKKIGFTKEVREGMDGKSLGKALEKMDSLISLTLEWEGMLTIPMDVLFARAPNLHHLRSLTLDGEFSLKPQQPPDSSQFPPNLTKLILYRSKLAQDPMPVLEKLPNLRLLELSLEPYVGKSMSCSAGGFPRLRDLILSQLHCLEEWRVEVGAMPSLTNLTINWCHGLKMLPEGLQHVTTLRELKLIDMPHEFNDMVMNEDWHKRITCSIKNIFYMYPYRPENFIISYGHANYVGTGVSQCCIM